MDSGRRKFGFFLLGFLPFPAQSLRALLLPADPPQGVRDPKEAQLPPPPEPPASDPKVFLKENHKKIKEDVQRLYELASQLRRDVEQTESSPALSISMVKKAEEAEKLAKQIRALALG